MIFLVISIFMLMACVVAFKQIIKVILQLCYLLISSVFKMSCIALVSVIQFIFSLLFRKRPLKYNVAQGERSIDQPVNKELHGISGKSNKGGDGKKEGEEKNRKDN